MLNTLIHRLCSIKLWGGGGRVSPPRVPPRQLLRRPSTPTPFIEGGEGCHLRVVPPGQLLRRPSTPKPFIEPGFSIFLTWSFFVFTFRWFRVFHWGCYVYFRIVFSFLYIFLYILYIFIFIYFIYFFHCTCGALQCSHGLWSLCRANSRWQTRSPAVGAL